MSSDAVVGTRTYWQFIEYGANMGFPLRIGNIFFGLIALIMIIGCSASDNQSNKTEEITSPPPPAKVSGDLKTEKELSVQETKDKGRLVKIQMLDAGETYLYEPANLTFKVGEKITFKITSETEFHTFTIDELDIYSELAEMTE